MVITDIISDGQHFDRTFAPTLTINGNGYTLGDAPLNGANYTVVCNYTGGPGLECTGNDPAANDGKTALTFNVSNEILTRGQNGKLIGGCVPPTGTGGPLPNCSSYNNGETTGTLTFRTNILENFTDVFPSGDPSVDQGDRLSDAVTITGDLLDVANVTTPTGQTEADTSGAGLEIAKGTLTKTIYAVNGSVCSPQPCTSVQIAPGDTVTYRIYYTLPTSDVENMYFIDYLPLPVFYANTVTAFDDVISSAAPIAGHAKFGPTDTFRTYSGIVPVLTQHMPSNYLKFTYGSFDDPANQSTVVDLLLTVTASNDPFADKLFLTNQVRAHEGSTNAGDQVADNIVQVQLTEPVLSIKKGVVATSNPAGIFAPAAVGPVTFSAPGTAVFRGSGTIHSNGLLASPINSNLSNVDAGDLITFAVVVENTGTGLTGAFDVRIKDTMPAGFSIPNLRKRAKS